MTKAELSAPVFTVRQHRQARFHALVSPKPAIIRVLNGEKRVEGPGFSFTIAAGGLAILPDHLPLSIENIPGCRDIYEAQLLVLDRMHFGPGQGVDAAAKTGGNGAQKSPVHLHVNQPGEGLAKGFDRLVGQMLGGERVPPGVERAMILELIAWLADAGANLPPLGPLCLADRVRNLVATSPDRDWNAEDMACLLAMSAPTLRRKLSAEDTSFLALLTDVRMTQGLALLQSTDWPVGSVALAVGYASPSRFAVRFRERFGLSPADIRHRTRQNDRNGTKLDRIRREAERAGT